MHDFPLSLKPACHRYNAGQATPGRLAPETQAVYRDGLPHKSVTFSRSPRVSQGRAVRRDGPIATNGSTHTLNQNDNNLLNIHFVPQPVDEVVSSISILCLASLSASARTYRYIPLINYCHRPVSNDDMPISPDWGSGCRLGVCGCGWVGV